MLAPSCESSTGRLGLATGETMVSMWLTMHDFNVQRAGDAEADRLIEGLRAEIKFSTLWEK